MSSQLPVGFNLPLKREISLSKGPSCPRDEDEALIRKPRIRPEDGFSYKPESFPALPPSSASSSDSAITEPLTTVPQITTVTRDNSQYLGNIQQSVTEYPICQDLKKSPVTPPQLIPKSTVTNGTTATELHDPDMERICSWIFDGDSINDTREGKGVKEHNMSIGQQNGTHPLHATSVLNPYATEFVPVKQKLVEKVEETIYFCYTQLTEKPASFEEIMEVVMNFFKEHLSTHDIHQVIISQLLAYSLQDITFPYHAVKIACHLIEYCRVKLNDDNLKKELVRRIKIHQKYIMDVLLASPQSDISQVRSFMLFLAEVYLQLHSNGSRVVEIGVAVNEICKKLLCLDYILAKDRVDAILAIIKLIGKTLDEDDSVSLNTLMGPFWIFADKQRELGTIDRSTFKMVDQITQLRYAYKWEVETPDERLLVEDNHQGEINPSLLEEAVFYGPDGNILSCEEQIFLETNDQQCNCEINDDGGMDEEMESAYDQFLAMDQQTNQLPSLQVHSQMEYQYHQLAAPTYGHQFH